MLSNVTPINVISNIFKNHVIVWSLCMNHWCELSLPGVPYLPLKSSDSFLSITGMLVAGSFLYMPASSSHLPVALLQQQEIKYSQTGSHPKQQPRGSHIPSLRSYGKAGCWKEDSICLSRTLRKENHNAPFSQQVHMVTQL